MPDFLLELLSEEIPARMQAKAQQDLARLLSEQLSTAGLAAASVETYATPRRLALIARGLPSETAPVREERKGPRADAPVQAVEGFLRSTGLSRDQIEVREDKKGGHVLFAIVEKPGRATASVLAEAIPAIVRAFPWPKSMRWGAASAAAESLRWVRPLQGIVALLGEEIVEVEIAGVRSGAATIGHRFHHPGVITIGSAGDYAEKLRACHVIIDPAERRRLIAEGAAAAAAAAGLALVEDEGLLQENAGLTEWPVPLLGSFDPAFLQVPREVIQLTMRTNQKYFACVNPPRNGEGDRSPQANGGGAGAAGESPRQNTTLAGSTLAPNFICTANLEASDGGAAIVAGNERVLSARLADAKFFWEQDLKVPLEDQAAKLNQIVFHEKLGTIADKVDRVAKLARWLVEEGIVGGGGEIDSVHVERSRDTPSSAAENREAASLGFARQGPSTEFIQSAAAGGVEGLGANGVISTVEGLAALAERAARLCKADLVTGMVGEFPELQGIIGGHLARAQGEPDAVADAIRDHYKPVGQGDEVPTAPVTVAVSLADKLDTLVMMMFAGERASGSRDPYALRRSAIAVASLVETNQLRLSLNQASQILDNLFRTQRRFKDLSAGALREPFQTILGKVWPSYPYPMPAKSLLFRLDTIEPKDELTELLVGELRGLFGVLAATPDLLSLERRLVNEFLADRLKVQQREAGVRHDLIDAVFALGGEDDLVRLLARVRALQAFVETPEGADLLAGYKRAANILKKEGWPATGKDRHPELVSGSSPETRDEAETGTLKQVQGDAAASAERPAPSPQGGEGWGEGAPTHRKAADAEPPRPALSPEGEGQTANSPLSYTPEKEEAQLIAALDSAAPRAAEAVAAEDFEAAMAALASLRGPVDAFFDKVTVNDPDPAKREARLALLARMRDAVHAVADFSRIEG